jgi:hypothetical protein
MFNKVLLAIVVISGVVVFFRSYHPSLATTAAAVVLAPTKVIAPPPTDTIALSSSPTKDTYIEVTGTALMDTTAGLPAVPFIQYITTDHSLVTKQLIFANSRGCAPTAGDIPCVPSYSADSAYPDLTTGERISVKGYIRSDRLLVYEITPL